MYHDYILSHMSNGRIEDARRQAAADNACRQVAQRKLAHQVRVLIHGLSVALAKRVKGRPAQAQR